MAMLHAGEVVRKGSYKCINCGFFITLYDDYETLPPCPKCREKEYFKL